MEIYYYILTGPLLLLFALLFKIFPAKKINYFYGYRTSRSMRDQESWTEANRYANNLMVCFFMILSVVELPLFVFLTSSVAVVISTGLIVVALITLVILTERHLKNKIKQ